MVALGPLGASVLVRIQAGQPVSLVNATPQGPPAVPPPPRLGLAIASLVFGILAFLLSLFLVGLVFGLVGLALGLIHLLGRRGPKAMAWWGVSLSVLGIIASAGLGLVYYQGFKEIKKTIGSMAG